MCRACDLRFFASESKLRKAGHDERQKGRKGDEKQDDSERRDPRVIVDSYNPNARRSYSAGVQPSRYGEKSAREIRRKSKTCNRGNALAECLLSKESEEFYNETFRRFLKRLFAYAGGRISLGATLENFLGRFEERNPSHFVISVGK